MTLPMSRPAPRLPGIYVETVSPPRTDMLPRVDIAAFAGFVSSGPLDLPVPVEDVSRFRDIFGPDLLLARDEAHESVQRSLLGPAVEAFFANGGRRAFVLRLADPAKAVTLQMPVPGLVDRLGAQAMARARAPGLWSARLAVDTRLRRRRLFPESGLRSENGALALRVAPGTEAPRPGDLLEVSYTEAERIALIVVERVTTGMIRARVDEIFWRRPGGSPPSLSALGIDDDGLESVDGTDPSVTDLIEAARVPDSLSVLTFDLMLWDGARIEQRLDGLGFAAAHPRCWARLPDDTAVFGEIFGRPTRRLTPDQARFEAEVAAPRFPLAGPLGELEGGLWLPDGMKTAADRDRAAAPSLPPGTRLEAEGLAEFSDRLFLDARFARLVTQALGPEMAALYASDPMRPGPALRGLHALAPIGEVAMLCVPDAVHRPWTRATAPGPEPLGAPFLQPMPRALDTFGRLELDWSEVPGAARYRLELADGPDFERPRIISVTDPTAFLEMSPDCPIPLAARVRAEAGGAAGPWSNTRMGRVPEEVFDDCTRTDPDRLSLLLTLDTTSSPGTRLAWNFAPPGIALPGDRFELQVGAAPGMEDGAPLPISPHATEHFPDPVLEGPRYFRVRAHRDDETGPWSVTLCLDASARSDWVLEPEREYHSQPAAGVPSAAQMLTAIHRGMIRFAAARGDLVALLSLPRHYRGAEVASHLATLSPLIDDIDGSGDTQAGVSAVPALRFGEEQALSYAALHHPWLATLAGSSNAFQPPDGAAAGLIARQANSAGVWIASANLPIEGAVALEPDFDDASLARLIAQQINPLRRDPRGMLVFNAETLSPEAELRPLPVRLLMNLLRRLALREGAAYVFEPHSAEFRALVRRRFERMLSLIHQRGGFVGDSPAQGFRVVTDESVNPPGAIDRGQFTVELRVAPSRPFRYLNIRLMRTGGERLSVEESA